MIRASGVVRNSTQWLGRRKKSGKNFLTFYKKFHVNDEKNFAASKICRRENDSPVPSNWLRRIIMYAIYIYKCMMGLVITGNFNAQVRGTIFNELDDDKLFSVIDFSEFEERFKLAALGKPLMNGDSEIDGLSSFPSKRFKKPDMISLLEHTRLRNIGE